MGGKRIELSERARANVLADSERILARELKRGFWSGARIEELRARIERLRRASGKAGADGRDG